MRWSKSGAVEHKDQGFVEDRAELNEGLERDKGHRKVVQQGDMDKTFGAAAAKAYPGHGCDIEPGGGRGGEAVRREIAR